MFMQKIVDVEIKMEMEKVVKISLVDLVGLERVNFIGVIGVCLKEGVEINRFLLILGCVIVVLVDFFIGKKKKGVS